MTQVKEKLNISKRTQMINYVQVLESGRLFARLRLRGYVCMRGKE
jgi:hypothetical protein